MLKDMSAVEETEVVAAGKLDRFDGLYMVVSERELIAGIALRAITGMLPSSY